MAVTFRDYKDHGSGTYVDPSNTPTDPTKISITKLTSTVMEGALTQGGTAFTFSQSGQYDLSKLGAPMITMADVNAAIANNTLSGTVSSFVVASGGAYVITQTYSPVLSLPAFNNFQDGTLPGYISALSGNDVYYTSATATATGGAWNGVYLYGGNDTYYQNHVLMTYSDIFYGGDGIDTAVFLGKASNYKIQAGTVWDTLKKVSNLPGFTISDNTKTNNTLQINQVERLQFTDTTIALDIDANQIAGSGYMLYKAAFNRTPDVGGLGFWINKMDAGMSYSDVAKNFVNSAEFKTAFGGANPTVNTLVTKLYNNVLNRTPDAGGLAFWQGKLNNEGWTTADVLGFFSTSGENVTNVTPLIANGIQYQQFVG